MFGFSSMKMVQELLFLTVQFKPNVFEDLRQCDGQTENDLHCLTLDTVILQNQFC